MMSSSTGKARSACASRLHCRHADRHGPGGTSAAYRRVTHLSFRRNVLRSPWSPGSLISRGLGIERPLVAVHVQTVLKSLAWRVASGANPMTAALYDVMITEARGRESASPANQSRPPMGRPSELPNYVKTILVETGSAQGDSAVRGPRAALAGVPP